jgi:hypothetical protein
VAEIRRNRSILDHRGEPLRRNIDLDVDGSNHDYHYLGPDC